MSTKTYSLTVAVIFLIIAALHFCRILFGWTAIIGSWVVPMWLSWAAVVVAGYLGYKSYKIAKQQ